MLSAPQQPRSKHRTSLSALSLTVALLLALLQGAVPFAHALGHLLLASHTAEPALHHQDGPSWSGTAADDRPCALCAADHLPALPTSAAAATRNVTARAHAAALPAFTRSSAPLDLFCRPPPPSA